MSEVITAVQKIPIPYSSKHVWVALEEDHLDHDDQIVQIGDVAFGAISKRKPSHPRYQMRGPDAFETILDAFPGLKDIEYGLIRDGATASIIF